MPLTPFLTATGFLAAILLVWAQSWVNIYKPEPLPATVGLGLSWTYLAVIVALAAFAWAGWSWLSEGRSENFRVPALSLTLLVTTLVMTGVNVGQSLVSVTTKLIRDIPLDKPLIELATLEARFSAIIVFFLATAFIIGMSWLGTTKNRWFWVAEVGFLIILGIAACVLVSSGFLYPHVVLSSK